MKTFALINALFLPLAIAWATPSDDLQNLTVNCLKFADNLIFSLNDTSAKNTSDIVQFIVYEVGASMANLGCNTLGQSVPHRNITNMTAPAALDDIYLDYTASLGDLSHAVIARGRVPHQELGLPVMVALQSLGSAVYYYGRCLRNGNFISQSATIRTWTAGSDITEAQTAWDQIPDAITRNTDFRRRKRSVRQAGIAK